MQIPEIISYVFFGIIFIVAVVVGTIGDYILDNAEEIINKQENKSNE